MIYSSIKGLVASTILICVISLVFVHWQLLSQKSYIELSRLHQEHQIYKNIVIKDDNNNTIDDNNNLYPYYYVPATTETYVLDHAVELGLHRQGWKNIFRLPSGCNFWKDKSYTNTEIFNNLRKFKNELDEYNERVKNFSLPFSDVRKQLTERGSNNNEICQNLELHHDGLPGIFLSQQLSYTSSSGYVEPLLPPMRHPKFCYSKIQYLLDTSYIIHDMAALCRKIKPTSRIVLIDVGASLSFFDIMNADSPVIHLVELYRKFGMPFDHIYAFEMKYSSPKKVFDRLPKHWMSAYHWINVGVSYEPDSKYNPYNLLNEFNDDDLIVIKLDIDTARIEVPLANQLLRDKRLQIIDQFYFEHHVFMKEIAPFWINSMKGTMQESLELFSNIRKKGIAAHFWV